MRTAATMAAQKTTAHPRGLYLLSFAELWERFGFYSVQALLVLFLVKRYGYSDDQAYAFFGAFSALIYTSPVIGGYLADKILGFRNAILLGSVLYILGYIGLASEKQQLFYSSLGLLIAGNGFFKSSVSTLIGELYQPHDDRRDSGFTIFYMGVNAGIFLAPILCTYAAANYGWGYGFGLAAVGLMLGLINCLARFKTLGNHGLPPKSAANRTLPSKIIFYVALVIGVWACGQLLEYHRLVNIGMMVFGTLVTIGLFIIALQEDRVKRNKIFALLLLMLIAVLFWTLYFQAYLSVTLFIERCVDRHFLRWEIPTGMLSSAIGFFNIALAPFFAIIWLRFAHSRWTPSSPMKFAIGVIFVSLTFLVIAFGNSISGSAKMSLYWIFFGYLLTSCGEMCLSPIGLSLVTALAPPNLVGMIMGIWFMTLAAGYAIAGHIAQFTSIPVTITDIITMKHLYGPVFSKFGYIGLAIGIVLVLLTPLLRRLMGDEKKPARY